MANYRYEHGFTKSEIDVTSWENQPIEFRNILHYPSYVETTEGEIFIAGRNCIVNDKVMPCYKIVTLKNGERRNVNMNNGVAYATTL